MADPPVPSIFVQAAFKGNLDLVKQVMQCHPEHIDHRDTLWFGSHTQPLHSASALTAAAIEGHVKVVEVLLNAGASTEIKDCTGATPLCEAVFHNRLSVVLCLLTEGGADVNAPNAFGWSPLHVAINKGDERTSAYRKMTECLLDKGGADINLTTPEGYTPLHLAAMKGDLFMVRKLLHLIAADTTTCVLEQSSTSDGSVVPSPLQLATYFRHQRVLHEIKTQVQIPDHVQTDLARIEFAAHVVKTGRCTLENYREVIEVLETSIGPRSSFFFTDISRTTKGRLQCFPMTREKWSAIQGILTKAMELYDTYQLPALERGELLPETVQEEVGSWGKDILGLSKYTKERAASERDDRNIEAFVALKVFKVKDGSLHVPDRGRFGGFLLKVLGKVQNCSMMRRDRHGCEVEDPGTLICVILEFFKVWLPDFHGTRSSNVELHSAEQELVFNELGRKFVSLILFAPERKTIFGHVAVWYQDWNRIYDLIKALLEWGAREVVNVKMHTFTHAPDAPPLHFTCSLLRRSSSYSPHHRHIIELLIEYGAHLDGVNSEGRTAYSILNDPLNTHTRLLYPGIHALIKPPVPLRLDCLVSRRLVEWNVAPSSQLEKLLPRRVINYVRLHHT